MPRTPRSSPLRPWLIGLLYGIVATVTILLTRFDGGIAHLWVATAVLLAELTIAPRRRWPRTFFACGVASFIATAVFGFGIAGLSFLLGAYFLLHGLIGHTKVQGWTTLVVLMSVFNGFMIALLSMLGEYVVRTLNAVSNREPYHVMARVPE